MLSACIGAVDGIFSTRAIPCGIVEKFLVPVAVRSLRMLSDNVLWDRISRQGRISTFHVLAIASVILILPVDLFVSSLDYANK